MNPTDAARKQARKKEIARNKMERDLQRATPKDVSEINKRLEELIEEEESEKEKGRPLSKQLHIRRKVLQDAMKLAVAKERARPYLFATLAGRVQQQAWSLPQLPSSCSTAVYACNGSILSIGY